MVTAPLTVSVEVLLASSIDEAAPTLAEKPMVAHAAATPAGTVTVTPVLIKTESPATGPVAPQPVQVPAAFQFPVVAAMQAAAARYGPTTPPAAVAAPTGARTAVPVSAKALAMLTRP